MARTRSPNYPVIDLESAVDFAAKLEKYAQRHAVPANAAIEKAWGMKPGGSYGYQCIAALRQFGLVQDEAGSGPTRQIRLTEEGAKVVHNHPDRASILRAAALKPKVHSAVAVRFKELGLPPDDSIRTYLLFDHDPPFNPAAVSEFIAQLRKTMRYAAVDLSAAKAENVVPLHGVDGTATGNAESKPKDESSVKVGDFVQWESGGVVQFPQPRRVQGFSDDRRFVLVDGSATGLPIEEINVVEEQTNQQSVTSMRAPQTAATPQAPTPQRGFSFRQDVYTLGDEGQVILQWPEGMSQDSYDEVADWLELQMRKIARVNSLNPKKSGA